VLNDGPYTRRCYKAVGFFTFIIQDLRTLKMVTFLARRVRTLEVRYKRVFFGINEVNEVDYFFATVKTFVKFLPTVINADVVVERVYKKLFV